MNCNTPIRTETCVNGKNTTTGNSILRSGLVKRLLRCSYVFTDYLEINLQGVHEVRIL